MTPGALALTTFLAAFLTDLATGIGGVPFLFVRRLPERFVGLAWGFSGGMMLSASVFNLVVAGVERGGYNVVAAGIAIGAALFWLAHSRLGRREHTFQHLRGAGANQILLIIGAMTVHSFSEGIAIGVGFGSGEAALAVLLTIAIAIHNIPEGLAVSLVLVPRGTTPIKATLWSIFTAIPQPLMAVPAYLFVLFFRPFLPFGLGLAAGAMLWMVFSELLPDALQETNHNIVGIVVTLALTLMIALQALL